MRWLWLLALTACVACERATPTAADNFGVQRDRMVKEQIVARGITDSRVIAAMQKVPREKFVPARWRSASYDDQPLPIGDDQTISQPYVVALMTEQLKPKTTDRVLEIGTGSGYQAAILAELVAQVYTVEIVDRLEKSARAVLQSLGYGNVETKVGDGYQGWSEHAPYDSIIVTCAPDHIPPALVEQLKETGRMIIPVGPELAQELYLVVKENGQMRQAAILDVRFVPMTREGRPQGAAASQPPLW